MLEMLLYGTFPSDVNYMAQLAKHRKCKQHTREISLQARSSRAKVKALLPTANTGWRHHFGRRWFGPTYQDNPEGIVPRALRMIKEKYPDVIMCTDVALDPYSNQGHEGVVEDGKILNDITITQLCKQAVCQAHAGSDIVAPSDMMVSRFTQYSFTSFNWLFARAYHLSHIFISILPCR
jgi:hypothetical protein